MIVRLRDRLLIWYLRLPNHPFKLRIVKWLARVVFPEEGVTAIVYPDLTLRLHPRDWIEFLLLQGEHYEPMTLDFLARNLQPGDGAVLAGVNFGQHVAVAARAAGPSGCIVGVEPQPKALLKTYENLRLNNLGKQVRLVSAALGRKPELCPMAWSSEQNSGRVSLFDQADSLIVQITPIANVMKSFFPHTPKLLLIDVEGFELEVLAGLDAAQLPPIIIAEIESALLQRAGTMPAEVFSHFANLGYKLFSLTGTPISPTKPDLPEHNVIGVLEGVEVKWSPVN